MVAGIITYDVKKKTGFLLPIPLIAEYERVAKRLGGKEKWVVISAAILMLIEADQETQDSYIESIQHAESIRGSYKELIADAKLKAQGPHKRGKAITNQHRLEQQRDERAATAKSGAPNS